MTIYRDVVDAEQRGDRGAVTRLSVALAHERIASTGARRVGLVLPRGRRSLTALLHCLRSNQLGFVFVDLSWERLRDDEEAVERAILVPGLEDRHIVCRQGEAVVLVDLSDMDGLWERLRDLRPGRTLLAVTYAAQSHIEALSTHNA